VAKKKKKENDKQFCKIITSSKRSGRRCHSENSGNLPEMPFQFMTPSISDQLTPFDPHQNAALYRRTKFFSSGGASNWIVD
jgi:hypothetical protein